MRRSLRAIALLAAMGSLPAVAQNAPAPMSNEPPPASRSPAIGRKNPAPLSTEDYVAAEARTAVFQVEASKLAQQKATNPDVQQFARQAVEDYGQALGKLKDTIRNDRLSYKIPTDMAREDAQTLQRLRSTSREAFDQAYIEMELVSLDNAFHRAGSYGQSGTDKTIKQFAIERSGWIGEQLSQAQRLQSALNPPSKTGPDTVSRGTEKRSGGGGGR